MVIKCLRRRGADFYATDEYEMTGLHLAAVKGNYDVIQYILRVEPDLIFKKDKKVSLIRYQEVYFCVFLKSNICIVVVIFVISFFRGAKLNHSIVHIPGS